MAEHKDKVIIITGASRGIGRALTKEFLKAGARVAAVARPSTDLNALEKEISSPNRLKILPMDVANGGKVASAVKSISEWGGKIDGLINNAGILTPKTSLEHVTAADWDESMRVNLKGPFLWIKHTLPFLKKTKGFIINVSSGAGKRAAPHWGPYAVSKFGLEGLTQLLAAELKDIGVRVNSVNPGGTRTAMRAQAYPQENPRHLPPPEEIVALFSWLASAAAQSITGQSLDYQIWRESNKNT